MAKRAGKAKGAELTIIGGATPKARNPSRRDFNRNKQTHFLSVLAETCNVRVAARETGVSTTQAYQRRKSDAAFRAGWAESLAGAYERLEMMLLERALNGTEKVVTRRDGSEERMREYSDRTALTLLRMHRDSAKEAIDEPAEVDVAEIRERLVEKLERLRKRFDAEENRN